jgi:hypothetical protein
LVSAHRTAVSCRPTTTTTQLQVSFPSNNLNVPVFKI